jgi:hypothetical protein
MTEKQEQKEQDDEISEHPRKIRRIQLCGLNYSVEVLSSYRQDTIEMLSSKALVLLSEAKRIEGEAEP